MSQVFSEDHRKLLVDIFFSIIITEGLAQFVSIFIFGSSDEHGNSSILTLLDNFINPSVNPLVSVDWLNALFFAVTFFWIICHWIFYHELINKYPYYRWRKFFVDITLFSLMFIILRISLSASDSTTFALFVSLIAFWYFLAYLWHLSDRGLRPVHIYTKFLLTKSIIYSSIFIVYVILITDISPLSNNHADTRLTTQIELASYTIMISLIVLMVLLNVERLNKFISRKESVSHCCLFYNDSNNTLVKDFPEGYLPQMFANQLFNKLLCKDGKSTNDNNNNAYYKEVDNNPLKRHSTEVVECLIFIWLSTVTEFHDPSFDFKEKRIPITKVDSLSRANNNIFLTMLKHSITMTENNGNEITMTENNGNDLSNLSLPESIIKNRKLFRHKDRDAPDSGIINIKRKYFDINIKYERSEHFPYSSSILLNLFSWPKIGRVAINPSFLKNTQNDRLRNTRWHTYHLELDANVKIMKRLHSIFSESISNELAWSDIIATSFYEFFDINRYIASLEK